MKKCISVPMRNIFLKKDYTKNEKLIRNVSNIIYTSVVDGHINK